MADTAVARRYARALLELGIEEDCFDQLGTDLSQSMEAFRANDGQIMTALSHPALSLQERMAFLREILPKLNCHKLVSNFLSLILEKGRFPILPHILNAYTELADVQAGRARAVVTTVQPLSTDMLSEVKASLEVATGKQILLETRIDPDLIGGIVASVGGKVYDASVRTRLSDIRFQLLTQTHLTPGEA